MFAFLDQLQRLWLLLLLILWAVLLFGGFLIGSSAEKERRMPKWTRLASSAVLVLAAWSWYFFTGGGMVPRYGLLIALGMTFGFLGDCFLAGILVRSGGKIGGIASFALGHLCYIVAILGLGAALDLTSRGPVLGALLFWWMIAVSGWYLVVFRGTSVSRLRWLVLPYGLLLSTTAGAAFGLALQEPVFWPLVLGAALFLLSDMILGGEWFNDLHLPLVHDIIWLTYGPGQMLIVYSIGIANVVSLTSP